MKRRLMVIAVGVGLLVLVTGLGTFITNVMPVMRMPQVQSAPAGPYTVTLRVDPNPPSTSQPTICTIQLQRQERPISNAHVTIEGALPDMDLGISPVTASPRGNGEYLASVLFNMDGNWQMQVTITLPGQASLHAAFMVPAQ